MNQLMSTFHDNLGITNEVRKPNEVRKSNIYIEKATKEEINSSKEQKAKQLPNKILIVDQVSKTNERNIL